MSEAAAEVRGASLQRSEPESFLLFCRSAPRDFVGNGSPLLPPADTHSTVPWGHDAESCSD